MIKRELAKDPKLATESWDRFLPNFRKKHLKTSEKTARKNEAVETKREAQKAAGIDIEEKEKEKAKKKVYTPFPPPQQPRKVGDKVTRARQMFLRNYHLYRLTFKWKLVNISSNLVSGKQKRQLRGKKRQGDTNMFFHAY